VVSLPDLGSFGSIALVQERLCEFIVRPGLDSCWLGELGGVCGGGFGCWVGLWEPGRRCPIGYLGRYLVVWIGSRDHVYHRSFLILFIQVNPRDLLNCKFCNSLVHLIFDYVIKDLIVDFFFIQTCLSNLLLFVC